eukprot:1472355-Pyramimonas_sp.AAC.1
MEQNRPRDRIRHQHLIADVHPASTLVHALGVLDGPTYPPATAAARDRWVAPAASSRSRERGGAPGRKPRPRNG